MQIITFEDKDFDALLRAFREGKAIGRYWSRGALQLVCATSQFMLVSQADNPTKIAIKPARSLDEAQSLALRLLTREEQRGNKTELEPDYLRGTKS